jgi:hypothetical protein
VPTVVRTVAGVAIGGAALWGIAGVDDTTRNDSGQIVEQGDLGAFVTQVGDCINWEDPSSVTVSVFKGVPCSSPHQWQVIFKGRVSAIVYEKAAISNEGEAICGPQYERLAEQLSAEKLDEYQNSTGRQMLPTKESFDEGDRVVDCMIGSDDEYFTSSLLD